MSSVLTSHMLFHLFLVVKQHLMMVMWKQQMIREQNT